MTLRVLTMPVPSHRRDTARTAEPVTFGVPLPKGLIADPAGWRIRSGSAGWSGVQTRVLDRWVDGSARWVLVDAQVNLGSDGRDGLELDLTGGPSQARAGMTVDAHQQSVAIDTGSARFELKPGRSFPFSSITSAGNLLDAGSCRLEATRKGGVPQDAVIAHLEVETTGRLRVVVRMDGSIHLDGRTLDLTARLHFFAGTSTVRLQVTVTNPDPAVHRGGFWDLGDPGSILFKDLSIRLALAEPTEKTTLGCSPELGMPVAVATPPFELYQDSSGGTQWQSRNHLNREHRLPVMFRGYRLRSATGERGGLRATPVVLLTRGEDVLGVSIPQFWQNFPKAIEASESGLIIRLFPKEFADLHELQGGEQKTHDVWLAFGGDNVSPQPLDWCRSPTLACVDPAWTIASGAVPFLAPLDPAHAALIDSAVEGSDTFALKREMVDEYGWRHFGDIYGDHESVGQTNPPLISHYNNQYDTVAGFVLQYLRTADPRWWVMADELARHVTDIDVYHTERDKSAYNGGLFWHTYHYGDADIATHRSYPRSGSGRIHGGGPSADHNYTTGLVLHYFLTGDEQSRQTVVGLANYVINMDDGRKTAFRWLDRGDTGRAACSAPDYYGPGRGPANSLVALVDGFRISGDRRFIDKANRLILRVVHPNDDIARNELDVHEERWFYTMFLQSLARFIEFKCERREIDDVYRYACASLLHYARWMVEHTYPYLIKPEKLRYPTETWPAQDMRKSDVFFAASRHAASAQERTTFLERGEFFFRTSLETLAAMPTRRMTRPIAVLLTSGFMRTWLQGRPMLPVENDPRDFGRPKVFVAQRRRAERRLKQLAVLIGAVVLILLGWGLSR